MRLESITLEGFGSYAERVEVPLEGLEFTGVVGPNYSGKSTLIFDALAWCLFAWTRADLTAGEVITRGGKKATVQVVFTLEGARWQVVRTLTSSGRHEATLYADDGEGGWEPVTDKHPGETNKAVTDLLGMGATSALATWMVQQNDFDALLSAKPSARRDILVEVFGLSRYATLAKGAAQRRKDTQADLLGVRAGLEQVVAALADLDAADQAAPLGGLDEQALADLSAQAERKVERARAAATAAGDLTRLEADAAAAAERLAAEEERAAAASATFTAALDQARRQEAAARTQAERSTRQARNRLEASQEEVRRARAAVAAASAAGSDLEAVRERATAAAQTVQVRAGEVEALSAAVTAAEASLAGLDAQIEATRTTWSREKARLEQIRVTVREGGGECFTCHQALSDQAAADLLAAQEELVTQIDTTGRQMAADREQAATQATQASARATQAAQALEQARRQAADLDRQATLLAERAAALPQAEADLETATQAVADARETLAEATRDADEALAVAAGQVAAATAALEEVSVPSPTLQDARAQAAAAADALAQARQGGGAQEAATALQAAQDEQRRVWAETERRTQAATQRATLTARQEKMTGQVAALEREETQWATLYQAFSPSGIPSRILADIAAELTDATNQVLVDLGAEFQVQVTTLRPARTKGATDREEVSVTILTADGEAKYASLSGAEKFMVSLAVRVGLAQCLAARSGRRVETMVLDEGWGNLDPEHRGAMMGMLASLARTFSIYAITHVEDVRDGFTSLIEVSRDSGSSQVSVTPVA